jgi:hypothetical protein
VKKPRKQLRTSRARLKNQHLATLGALAALKDKMKKAEDEYSLIAQFFYL